MRHHVCVYFVRFERYDRQSRAQRHMLLCGGRTFVRGRGRARVSCQRERCMQGWRGRGHNLASCEFRCCFVGGCFWWRS